MIHKARILIAIPILSLFSAGALSASDDWSFKIGTYMESESHFGEYTDDNMIITPALTFGIENNNVPLYFNFVFENRDKHSNSADENIGDELRHRYHMGTRFNLGGLSVNPEYELRIKNYLGSSFNEKSVLENRFHIKMAAPLNDTLGIYANLMPTLIINNGASSREDGTADKQSYNDYYQEMEVGMKYNFSSASSVALGVYNELGARKQFENSDGSVNNGQSYLTNEFQARVYYNHTLDNGISLNPYARIGLYKKSFSQTAGGEEMAEDFRRDRIGLKMSYTADNGIKPFTEMYYQNENMAEEENRHRVLWKVGVEYSF